MCTWRFVFSSLGSYYALVLIVAICQSDYDVCMECGSVSECIHDTPPASPVEPPDSIPGPSHSISESVDKIEMVSVRPVIVGEEVFNTYGSRLSNAQLLARYGFILEGNEWDTVSWTREELAFDVESEESRADSMVEIEEEVPEELVFSSVSTQSDGRVLCVNSDAQISVALLRWAISQQTSSSANQADVLRALRRVVEDVEDTTFNVRIPK